MSKHILESFAAVVFANQGRLYKLWLIAPWFGVRSGGSDPLNLLLEASRARRCAIIVVTRPPEKASHSQAVALLQASGLATVFFSSELHTKLYIAECNGFRLAVLGSPNFTPSANERNMEVAIEFRTTAMDPADDVTAMVSELTLYASSLRGNPNTRLA